MEIPFQGRFDESMLRRTTLTALRPARGRLFLILFMVFALAWGFIIFPLIHGQSPDPTVYLPALFIVGFFAFTLFVWGPKKQLQSKLLQGLYQGTVGDAGVHLETTYTKTDFPWDVFVRAKIGKDVVLLYASAVSNQVQLFPREFFTSETDWTAFVELVRQRVTPEVAKKGLKGRTWLVFLIWIVVFILIVFGYNVFHAAGR